MIPAVSAAAYDAARHRAAVLPRSDRGRIVVSGADRASYLQGLFTNDIVALGPGRGCYTAYLTAQGRMIADAWVYELGDVILLSVAGELKTKLLARLDQFLFSEDVQLGDVTDTFTQVGIVGPQAAAFVAALVPLPEATLAALPEHGNLRRDLDGSAVIVTRTTDAGEPGFDVYVERTAQSRIDGALERLQLPLLDEDTAEAIRIEGGIPKFHRDMDEDTIPLEAGIESRAISFTKGCYVGQEVIIRVLHRGHGRVARRLVGLNIDGSEVPAPGSAVSSQDRDIGGVTSAAFSPALQRPIALAYVHRDFVEPGTTVQVGGAAAQVVSLPFVRSHRDSD
jgi:folate-binding protein YgfZ